MQSRSQCSQKFSWLVAIFVATVTAPPSLRAAGKKLPQMPVVITFIDTKAGEERQVEGHLEFKNWPVLIDGKPAVIPYQELLSRFSGDSRERCWMKRVDEKAFQLCSRGRLAICAFAFKSIALAKEISTEAVVSAGEAVDGDPDEDLPDEFEDEPAPPKKKEPLIRLVVKKLSPGLSEIPVRQIRRIDIIAVKWNPWE